MMTRSYVPYIVVITLVVLAAFALLGVNPVASLMNFIVCTSIANAIAVAVVWCLSSLRGKPEIEKLEPKE